MAILIGCFMIGILCLLLGETKNPIWDIIGFILVIGSFIVLAFKYSLCQ